MNQHILPGFDFESFGAENEDDIKNINKAEIEKTVLWATDWTVGTLISQIEKGNIILNPSFQRRDAWTVPRKSRFIESVILNLPIPQIVLAESNKKLVVVDGKQRLLSLMQFVGYNGWESFKLKDLQILDLNGFDYESLLETDYHMSFDNNTIRTVILKNKPSEQLINIVFHRLNTNSVALSPQELRQSLHAGEFTKFANDYTQNNVFLAELFGRSEPDFRMRDVELLIRHIAFKISFNTYNGNLKQFLDTTCETLNNNWKNEEPSITKICQDLEKANSIYIHLLGKDAYKKYYPDRNEFEFRFNRAIFDVAMHFLSVEANQQKVLANEENFYKGYLALFSNDDFISSIESTTKSNEAVRTRFGLFGEMIRNL